MKQGDSRRDQSGEQCLKDTLLCARCLAGCVQGCFSPCSVWLSQEAVLLHVWCCWPTAWEALSNPTLLWACLRSSVWQDRWVSCPLLCPLSCLSHLIMDRNVVCATEHGEFVCIPCLPQPFNLRRERGSRQWPRTLWQLCCRPGTVLREWCELELKCWV